MSDLKSLEHPTLKVPYEVLNKKFRTTQKTLDREVSHFQNAVQEFERDISSDVAMTDTSHISSLLSGMVEKLKVLKRKADEGINDELQAGLVCKKRLEHLKEHNSPCEVIVKNWRRRRLDRMLVEYFLRCGYYNSANKLANNSDLNDLTNIDLFMISKEVEHSLANHETSKCLAWCHDNRSKLRKLRSTMEFNLRIQEFIELVRQDKRLDAVRHARKYISTFEDTRMDEVQQCMVLLAFPTDTEISPYKDMFDETRWQRLIEQFRQENYNLYQLSSQSVFTVVLQAGLSALKTPQCYSEIKEARNISCPVCQEWFNTLAKPLPFAHCSQSRLFCSISGLPLNEHNIPMVLPNGYVYGEQALVEMSNQNNGQVICPKTKEVYWLKQAEKVYVM
ncbi:E3 ubiquitin-protein transferase MAEA [Acyrthosiphon pisum]|uniref:E3 ubiquitin-protein transferase MAEA n=1 Tax=Acyrthosiphon pisum TaxID=7029 RepID=A0A8R2FBP0_ACYPI|nr:E3 ubiquitin-protein transferase MAEA [Acyrthosiphon pisum]XP_008185358.1 E3 ubiquitin-protein transferase MAEA [Acyrthosiphon pisum]|eukprot:XP_001948876.1 PREDICTED: macrophage erythroblast attacher [Acyrthosiphon pisum]